MPRTSNEFMMEQPVGVVGYSFEFKRSPMQHESSKERIPSTQTTRSLKFQNKFRVENSISHSYTDLHHGLTRQIIDKPSSTRQKQQAKKKLTQEEELIRNMTNLPGYLCRVEKTENIQDKALNVGVLDWERLEKWKHTQKFTTNGSSSSSSSPHRDTLTHQSKQTPPLHSRTSSSRKLKSHKEFEVFPKGSLDRHKNLSWVGVDKGYRSNFHQKINLEAGISSPLSRNLEDSFTSTEKTKVDDEESKKSNVESEAFDFDFANQNCSGEHGNIVLLSPTKSTEVNRPSFSDGLSSNEFNTGEPYYDIPHSCPLPYRDETESNSVELPLDGFHTREMNKRLDREIADVASAKGRTPSPNRRFGIGRFSRSFSFKEGSTIPKLNTTYTSVKSGPVKQPADSANPRARSSPLRRLLDPILKATGPRENSSPSGSRSVQHEKHEGSRVQALLQVTIKNGLPFFKFVVEKNNDILAATVKKLSTGKDDSIWAYTFCSVREIKKKSGSWINQGSREKSCGYVYTVVGQMKVSSSHFADFVIRESILYGVEIRQADQGSPELIPTAELAATVVKIPIDDQDRKSQGSTTVVLPGGVHTLPNKGVLPSPLIQRWRSGGSCDCGGWDIGCKLLVLAKREARPDPDHLNLFIQGGAEENKPIFSLTPFKDGIYSVDFNASMSLLQAFSICVALICDRKSFGMLKVSDFFESRPLPEPNLVGNGDGTKTPNTGHGEAAAKYVTNPPLSPVGRV